MLARILVKSFIIILSNTCKGEGERAKAKAEEAKDESLTSYPPGTTLQLRPDVGLRCPA
jgi:hypothetical protein